MIWLFYLLLISLAAVSLRYNWWRIPISYNHPRILMYHSINEHKNEKFDKWRVAPKDFEKHISWLKKNGFNSYTISELLSLKTLPKKAVCITFDDGFMDNYKNAYPILKKYGFKATIYIVPNQINNHWDQKNTSFISCMLNNEQIIQMCDIVEFGSHTMSHINLEKLEIKEVVDELKNSKKAVEKITKIECNSFAYPYGKYNFALSKICMEAGYKNAVTVKRGVYKKGDDKFEIKRIGILGTESFIDFWLKITRVRNKL